MRQRRVYSMPKPGSIKNLKLQTEALPDPQAHEVCVQVKAIGLNFADVFAMQGLYKAAPKGKFIPGLEFSGEVIAVGDEVGEWKVGDKVMGATKFGGYVSHINIHHRYVIPLPVGWSFEQGAGFLVQGLTAYYALKELGNLQKGMTVLIHSAAGGVGILANRICKKYDAYTIGTVSQTNKVDFLRKQEAYDDIILRDDDFYEKLLSALGERPLNLIMECIGGKVLKQGWQAMAPMGRMVSYGSASFTSHGSSPNYPRLIWKYLRRPKIDPMSLPTQNKSIMGFNLIYLYEQTDMMHEMLSGLQSLQLKPQHVGHVYNFEEMLEAIRLFQRGKSIGKVVVKVEA
ncbi:NADPH:quinone reductase-like Zn-dependent oxidoreductase [Catalinimonas alkaloidigena]|uniref:synaptic vesicle VAT-1 family membrane protein n=1 Tax=Catalinimonas alkaloidigena TaxID=1075417 RepID=UPI0024054518|nr:medium chain dehydrogenase/reductase family protein [Catalinimonas alkaloidigena]MDF9798537.1 NADPH:quinone reductase-like Zn-dependent oxidoreductase [Catalinimonas alkaloidigena]